MADKSNSDNARPDAAGTFSQSNKHIAAVTVPHPALKDANQHAIDRIIDKTSEKVKRRRILPPTCGEDEPSTSMAKSTGSSSSSTNIHPPSHMQSGTTVHINASPDDGNATQEQNIKLDAPIHRVTSVFPEYLSGAIARIPCRSDGTSSAAAILMSFPNFATYMKAFDCTMSFGVMESHVPHIAMTLFNVHVKTTDKGRHLLLPSGVIIEPRPKLILRGCQDEAFAEMFGPQITAAVKASQFSMQEASQGIIGSEYMSMAIAARADEFCTINLNLGLKEGVIISHKLYS